MAAIYDAQGNYIGDDGAPDLDQMKLELVKKNIPLSSQIPGYDRPVPPAQTKPDPLASAAGNFTALATKFNPLMMMKSMQEAARTLNPAIPVAGAWADVAQNVQTAGAEAMYDILGNRQGVEKMQQNYVPVTTGRFYQEPTTSLGKEFESGVTKAMDVSKIPAMWPMAMNQPVRPLLTPNDLRVMGAEATRVGRQVKDIPTDFVNAQSGLQKLDPITGQPTYGAKLQGVAESVGDIMAQREMQGLPPIPGLPASMQPMNPKLYAMRPEGSRLTSAVIPETAKGYATSYAPAQDLVSQVIDSATITPAQALEEIQGKILRGPEASSARDAFVEFIKQKANEMYPDAPTIEGAVSAYKARFGNKEASAAHTLGIYDEFLQTPEGIQYRAALDLPSADELYARHEAAANWLNSQFTNYINEKVGTPNEPAAKLASQGLTFMPPNAVFDAPSLSGFSIGAKRTKAGMPAKTATDEALAAADEQLSILQQQATAAKDNKIAQETMAHSLGYGAIDPNTGQVVEGMNVGQYAPFAEASRIEDKASNALLKQQQKVDNLRLGSAYENATDVAIESQSAKDLKEDLEYRERQFYPALMRTPDTERAYTASTSQLQRLGFGELARNFYDDVMSGKIQLDKVPKMTVEKYIRQTAESRIAKEKLEQLEQAKYKAAVDEQFKKSAREYIPNSKVFGNVGALEITNALPREKVARLVSEDTTALDHCIGEGGTARNTPNLWQPGTGNRSYEPAYNVATGERNPKAPSPRMSYINAVEKGAQMVSFRDIATGIPVATFQLEKDYGTPGVFSIGFASGPRNQQVAPQYVEGIKNYLNSRPDISVSSGGDLQKNLGIFERNQTKTSTLAQAADMSTSEFKNYDLSGMPRFVTRTDIRNYIDDLKANGPAMPVTAPAVTLSQRPSESIGAYASGAVSSAIDNTLDAQRRQLTEAGEENYIPTAETFFEDIRGYFNAYLDAQGPARALELTNQRLYDLESDYANSNRIGANIIAEGINDLQQTLGLQAEYIQRRMDATEPAATPDGRPDYLRMTHDATMQLSRQMGEEAGNEMSAVIRAITEQQGIDPARNTDQFIMALREAAGDAARGTVEIALNELADLMDSEYIRDWEPEVGPPAQAQQPAEYRPATQDQASAALMQINREIGNQARQLSDEHNAATTQLFAANLGRLYGENNLNEIGDTPASLNRFGYYLQGYRDDLAAQIPALNREGFTGVAAASAIQNVINAVDTQLTNFRIRGADLDNQRNDRIFQLENAVNDPELNPDDLRFLANELSNPLNQAANNHWISLTEPERRDYAQALRERANYIEFSPADFAIRLSNEAGANIPDLRDTVQALNDGTFDHEILRGLNAIERDRASQRTALHLNHIVQGMQAGVPPAQQPAMQQNMRPFDFTGMVDSVMGDMSAALPDPVVERVSTIAHRVAERTNPRLDPEGYAEALRRISPAVEHVAVISALNDLADRVAQAGQPANPAANPAARRPAQVYMNAAHEIADMLNESEYSEYATGDVAAQQIDNHLRDLQRGGAVAFEDLLGIASIGYEWSTGLMQALELVLSDLATRYRTHGAEGEQLPDGNAEGGPVCGYQKGGMVTDNVPTPSLFSVQDYSNYVAKDMYPGKVGIDDQRDAARHMLAAGTLARKYNPWVAEQLGKLYEFKTAPIQHVKSWFGGDMPPDYYMDTHNNAVGAKLGSQARTQSELEDLVQAEAEKASKTKTPGQAFILRANGGIVQQNPTIDQMRYALMMRRK